MSRAPPPRTQDGQIWKLGKHRLFVGDATDPESYIKLMSGEEADLLLTDPPYNVNIEGHAGKIINDDMPEDDFYGFLLAFANAAQVGMKDGGAFYVWHADGNGLVFRSAMEDAGLHIRQNLIWVKSSAPLSMQDYQWKHEACLYGWKDGAAHYFTDSRKQTTVFEDAPKLREMTKDQLIEYIKEIRDGCISTTVIHEQKPAINELHPTMKPIKLIARQIMNSTREGEIVLDPFGGSGTTLIAAEQLNRRCYMMELDPQYADVIITRWEKLTGEVAELED